RGVVFVVTDGQHDPCAARVALLMVVPVLGTQWQGQLLACLAEQVEAGMADLEHDRPAHLGGVVLLGTGPVITQVHGGEVDAADVGHLAVHHHDLAVQPAEQVGAHAEQARLRVEYMDPYPGIAELGEVFIAQVDGAVAIHDHLDMGAIAGSTDQRFLQLLADLVLENDEGLEQNFLLSLANAFKYPGEEFLTVDQHLDRIAFKPDGFHLKRTSTASGAWSDRWDHGRRYDVLGLWVMRLRVSIRSRHSSGKRAGKVFAGAPLASTKASRSPHSCSWASARLRQSLKSPATITGSSAGNWSIMWQSRRSCSRLWRSRNPRCTQMACRSGWPGTSSMVCKSPRSSVPVMDTSRFS